MTEQRVGFMRASVAVLVWAIVCSSPGVRAAEPDVSEVQSRGFTQCGTAANALYLTSARGQPAASRARLAAKSPNDHPMHLFVARAGKEGNVHVLSELHAYPDGRCNGVFTETWVVPEACEVLREALARLKQVDTFPGDTLVLEESARSSTFLSPVVGGRMCLVSRNH